MRGIPRLWLVAWCLFGVVAPGQSRGEGAEHPDVPLSMLSLTRAMLGIQKSLEAGDTMAVSAHAAELQQAAAAGRNSSTTPMPRRAGAPT